MNSQVHKIDLHPPDIVLIIAGAIRARSGKALVVGGWVRDNLIGLNSADVDMEIYRLTIPELESILNDLDLKYDAVGADFGILKLKDYDVDLSIPRKENRIGVKHTDFEIQLLPDMLPVEAAKRRDFTVNSMYYDPITKEFEDPFNGYKDLNAGILKMTSVDTFIEDPLRVLRAMQFISRFNFDVDSFTLQICQRMSIKYLVPERIFEEWKKMLLKGRYISKALQFLQDCFWDKYFPELKDLQGNEQDKDWHPEGDTWTHIKHCMDAFSQCILITDPINGTSGPNWEYDRLVVGFGTLLHDVGKPSTTTHDDDGHIRALRHDKVGVPIAEVFMRRMTSHEELIADILPMVGEHMFTANFKHNLDGNNQQLTARAVKRLSRRCPSINLLCYVIQFDKQGRPPLVAKLEDVVELRMLAETHHVSNDPPPPIMMGRHLIELGLEPGPQFGKILEKCQLAEDEGEITNVETGKHFVTNLLVKLSVICAGLDSK